MTVYFAKKENETDADFLRRLTAVTDTGDRHTPNLDAREAARMVILSRTLGCSCRNPPPSGKERTVWLRKHGQLTKKSTAIGWRRAWQCNSCLRDMSGDGKNFGPPTVDLPEFLGHDDPVRKAVTEQRRSAYDAELAELQPRRDAWFKDHDLYLATDRWNKLRTRALERDNFQCVQCGSPAEHVHHLTYERWQNEELSDLVSLCRVCHEKEHQA